jgi:hypothetical protein
MASSQRAQGEMVSCTNRGTRSREDGGQVGWLEGIHSKAGVAGLEKGREPYGRGSVRAGTEQGAQAMGSLCRGGRLKQRWRWGRRGGRHGYCPVSLLAAVGKKGAMDMSWRRLLQGARPAPKCAPLFIEAALGLGFFSGPSGLGWICPNTYSGRVNLFSRIKMLPRNSFVRGTE